MTRTIPSAAFKKPPDPRSTSARSANAGVLARSLRQPHYFMNRKLLGIPLLAGLFTPAFLASAQEKAAPAATRGPREGGLPRLPEAITSFGAAVSEGMIYVYGGHIGEAHDHSAANHSEHFVRLDLAKAERGGQWEPLPMRQKLQGLALVSWQGKLIRIGGVESRNQPGKETDMHSTAGVELYDPAAKSWNPLTPLPEPRSSFDAAVMGDLLYVVGGWTLSGDEKTGTWIDKNYVADLRQNPIKWEPLPSADFRHRALAVAATGKRVYAIGGLTEKGKPTSAVRIYDPTAKSWSEGPAFPATGTHAAFGISAYGVGDTIWASAADGKVFALDEGATEWRDCKHTLTSPRFFHRILPTQKGSLLFIAGASRAGHRSDVESVDLALLNARPLDLIPALEAPARGTKTSAGQPNWPGFRSDGTNHTTARDLPLHWSDTENLAWTATLDGYGQSSPLVFGGRAFVTSVEGPSKEKLHVAAFDVISGTKQWQKTFAPSQTWQTSDYVSKAAPTPAVDPERVYAFFETGDLIALNHKGDVAWQRSLVKDYGEFKGNHGVGTSLAQSAETLYLAIEHDGPSYLLALDKRDGSTRWKTDLPKRVAWSTPLLVDRGGESQLVLSSAGVVESYAAKDGHQLWSTSGIKGNNVPSPTLAGELVIVGSTDRGQNVALKLDGTVAWRAADATSSFSSPVVAADAVYFVNKAGVAFSHDRSTGAQRWSLRLPDSCWATPVVSGDRVFFFSKNGATTVLSEGPEGPRKLAESKLSVTGRVYGVAAIDGAWLIRTGDRLVCIRQ